jgi:nucleoid DNA-binding protein
MSKEALVAALSEKTGFTKTSTREFLGALPGVLKELILGAGEEGVRLNDIGTFKLKTRAARTGRNPQTGATVAIPAKVAISFKPAKNFKDNL